MLRVDIGVDKGLSGTSSVGDRMEVNAHHPGEQNEALGLSHYRT